VDGPLRTAELVPHNLPVTLSSFVGRVEESRAVARLLEESRLVVLTGVGGTGKTRLAVECARGQLAAFDDGVWMVELAPVATDALVMAAIGDVFELRPGESASITDVVTRYLWPKSALVVLDNCEHDLRGAASAIRAILAAAPHVRILATSRESIGIDGEVLVRVPTLGLPTGGDPLAAESVQMFLDRADATAAELSAGTMQAIADICRRVDGIPLGVELAAARVRSMSPEELLDRLDSSFRILGGSSKSFAERQRTLNANDRLVS
jgi:predicted ATPase